MLSLPARSQTATSIASPDSAVVIPKHLAVYMLQDLSQCDSDRVELAVLRAQADLQNQLLEQTKRAIEHLQMRNTTQKEAYDMCVEDRTALEVAARDCDRRVKRARRWSTVGWMLSTVLVGVLVVK